jgi:peptide/nickel transport system permease protein
VGWLVYNSIKQSDFPVIQGSTLFIIIWVALVNFAVDMAYPLIDPRIRAGGAKGS